MDSDSARTVAETMRTLFHGVHDSLREQVRDVDHGTLNWKPLPKANSIAVLVVHTLGSEMEMIRSVRSVASDRDRPAEFKAEADSAELLTMLDEADKELDRHLDDLTADDLTAMRPRPERPPRSGVEWLISNYGHAREHLAQIELTKQLYDSRT